MFFWRHSKQRECVWCANSKKKAVTWIIATRECEFVRLSEQPYYLLLIWSQESSDTDRLMLPRKPKSEHLNPQNWSFLVCPLILCCCWVFFGFKQHLWWSVKKCFILQFQCHIIVIKMLLCKFSQFQTQHDYFSCQLGHFNLTSRMDCVPNVLYLLTYPSGKVPIENVLTGKATTKCNKNELEQPSVIFSADESARLNW